MSPMNFRRLPLRGDTMPCRQRPVKFFLAQTIFWCSPLTRAIDYPKTVLPPRSIHR